MSIESVAAILLRGAWGTLSGPSGIYAALAAKLPAQHAKISVLVLDYRVSGPETGLCTTDTVIAMDFLQNKYGASRFVIVG